MGWELDARERVGLVLAQNSIRCKQKNEDW